MQKDCSYHKIRKGAADWEMAVLKWRKLHRILYHASLCQLALSLSPVYPYALSTLTLCILFIRIIMAHWKYHDYSNNNNNNNHHMSFINMTCFVSFLSSWKLLLQLLLLHQHHFSPSWSFLGKLQTRKLQRKRIADKSVFWVGLYDVDENNPSFYYNVRN